MGDAYNILRPTTKGTIGYPQFTPFMAIRSCKKKSFYNIDQNNVKHVQLFDRYILLTKSLFYEMYMFSVKIKVPM